MVPKRVYFLSDLHLGAKYLQDPMSNERRVVRFLESIGHDAGAVYLLGDVLDYWFEYKNVVPRGYVRFLGALARLADAGVPIFWLTGNHDVWLFDYLRDEIGMTVLTRKTETVIMGHRFFLSHGDDVGHQRPMYRFMRYCFYNRVCQWIYAAIHPRWTYCIAHGWSTQNRTHRKANAMVTKVEKALDNLIAFSVCHKALHPGIEHYVYGHLHIAQQEQLDSGADITILGDWIKLFTYATFDGEKMTLHKFED